MLGGRPGLLICPLQVLPQKVLFDDWDSWTIYARVEAKQFMVQMIKDINTQVIEDPSMTKNIRGQAVQAGEVIEQPTAEATPSARKNKRKETSQAQDSAVQPKTSKHSVAAPEPEMEAEYSVLVPIPEVEENRMAGTLVVVTSPLKPTIVALEKLNSTPGKAKSKAMDEAVDRVKIWQSTELDLD
ncbi:unnamed protein product [Prunus armeniaca]